MQKKLSLLLENRTKYHWQPTVHLKCIVTSYLIQSAFTCSKLTIESLARRRSGVFIVNFQHTSHLVLLFLCLTLNMWLLAVYVPVPMQPCPHSETIETRMNMLQKLSLWKWCVARFGISHYLAFAWSFKRMQMHANAFSYLHIVSIRLHELAWRSNGSIKFQTVEFQSNGLGA